MTENILMGIFFALFVFVIVVLIAGLIFMDFPALKSFFRNTHKVTDLMSAKLGYKTAGVDNNTQRLKADTMKVLDETEKKRQKAMKSKAEAEIAKKRAFYAEQNSANAEEQVLLKQSANADLRIAINEKLLAAGIDPNYVPLKGHERHPMLITFFAVVVFLIIISILHKYGIIL